ncbi:MAG: DNA polymerase Y family protein [Comamonadaceae bacterium]|nr:MAG: DNA polymerase Y family protein [Comamonadaceae bacterium]
MYWIALQPSHEPEATAWAWQALRFTPRVACVDEAVVLEAGASERLFGGRKPLLRGLLKDAGGLEVQAWAAGPTALVALSLLRLKRAGQARPQAIPEDLPLASFTAARAHLHTLDRIGCTTLGQLRSLPRSGVSRRFGADLLHAIDCAWGERPERYPWITLPASFDQKVELQALATSAPDLMFAAQHLLMLLQAWLQARNQGVLALELEWTLDLRRLDGKLLPPNERLELRTAQPTQDMRHLRRLASEQLARSSIAAPANALRLRTLETVPWGGVTTSLLPEDNKPGEKLHQLVERLSVRLGAENVTVPEPVQDHRPECMQQWRAAGAVGAASVGGRNVGVPASPRPTDSTALVGRGDAGTPTPPRIAGRARNDKDTKADPLSPPWLLREPLRLQVKADKPFYQGPLQLLTRARRIEAAWWDVQEAQPVLRDYFIARSAAAGLLWIYRERLAADQDRAQWFLHGLYA